MSIKKVCGIFIIIVVLAVSLLGLIFPAFLVPTSYGLAVDGYVVGRTLVLLFLLNKLYDFGVRMLQMELKRDK